MDQPVPTTRRPIVAARTDVGVVRELNEDACVRVGDPLRIAVVADGMGGHEAGEEDSAAAIAAVQEQAESRLADAHADEALQRLGEIVHAAHQAVLERAPRGAGTTFTALARLDADAERWAVANVGDSRVYRRPAAARMLEQLTVDHSAVQMLVDAGQLTADEARVHPRRNVITRALGSDEQLVVDVGEVEARTGDRFLLCSDGLTGELRDEEILDLLDAHQDVEDAVDALIDAALWRGAQDNVTVVLVQMP